MPEESWRPRVPFNEWDFAKIYSTLDVKGREWNAYVASLGAKHGWQSQVTKNAYFEGRDYLKSIIFQYAGTLPNEIDFRSQTLQTKDIDRKYGFDHRSKVFMMYPQGKFRGVAVDLKRELNDVTIPFGGGWSYQGADWPTIEKTMLKWIDSRAPVIVDLDWNKTDRHTMVVVDYESENGHLKRWKVKNSWGNGFGDQGYTWYTYQDLRAHAYRIWRFGYDAKKS